MANTVTVNIVGDSSRLKAELGQAGAAVQGLETKLNAFGDRAMASGKKLTLGMTLPLAAVGFFAVKAASDLSESINKVDVVFGQSAPKIKQWSQGSAQSLGISQQAALEAAGTFGNLFRALDIGEKPATTMSQKLVGLASDLASFNNADPTEVLLALRSGLVGEVEPLRKFGVSLSQARIESKALELGLWDGNGAISASAKAQAAYAIILDDTTLAQGDFARTSEGAANQSRILSAELKDAAAQMGSVLLPAALGVLGVIRPLVGLFGDLPAPVQTAVLAFGGLAAVIGPIKYLVGGVATLAAGLISAFGGIVNAGLRMAPMLAEIGAAAATAAVALGAVAVVVGAGLLIDKFVPDSFAAGIKEATEKAKEWARETITAAKGTGDEAGTLKGKLAELNVEMKAQADQGSLSAAQLFEYATKHKALKTEIDAVKAANREAEGAERAQASALQDLAAGAEGTGKAFEDARKAVQELQNELLAAQGGEVGLQQAQLNAIDAQDKYNQAVLEFGPASREAQDASLNLQSANLSAAGAAVKLSDDNKALADTLRTQGVSGLEAMRGKLQEQVAAHGDASGAIQGEINKINDLIAFITAIPPDHATNITADASNAYAVLDNLTRRLEAYSQSTYNTSLGAAIGAAIPVYASKGGFVPGSGNSDSVPAMLTPGEFVVSKDMMRGAAAIPSSVGASGSSSGTVVFPLILDGKVLTEVVVSNLNRAGGPTISQRAVNN